MATDLRARIDGHPLWYHTMELAPGVVTPGWFDLRPIVDRLPWPDVTGKRCLDIGTWDGFLAFEMERRGAAEVVATDIASHADWDHLPRQRADAIEFHEQHAGEKGAGFAIAAEALGSKVHREWINIYDLSPERLGTFDVVVCGTLLLHLRSPFVALEAIRSVCRDAFMSAEQIDPRLTLVSRTRPAWFVEGDDGRWTVPNSAAHVRQLEIAGFDVVRRSRPYVVPFGPAHPPRATGWRSQTEPLIKRIVTRGKDWDGVLHSAVLSRRAELDVPGQ
jgi:tRNA (mo5U34)-methyltransferase